MKRIPLGVPALACACLILTTAGASQANRSSDSASGRHTLEGPEVSVFNIADEMRVVPGDGPSVEVEITTAGRDGGRRIRVTGRGPGLDAHADIRVLVPRGKRVHLHLAVGRASISDVEADVSFEGVSSSVQAERLSGAFAVSVGSGDIRVASMSADCGSGEVNLDGTSAGKLSIDAGSGTVELVQR